MEYIFIFLANKGGAEWGSGPPPPPAETLPKSCLFQPGHRDIARFHQIALWEDPRPRSGSKISKF